MLKALPPLKRITEISRVAARLSSGAVPRDHHLSLPIPAPGPAGLRVGFLFAPVREHEDPRAPQRALRVWAPEYVAWVLAETAAFEELRRVSAKDLGVAHPDDVPLAGPWPSPIDEGKRTSLCDACDAVLGFYAAGAKKPPPPVRSRALTLDALFEELAEPALVPFYRSVGRAFFTWLDRVKG